ncbi:MAG: chemotaxis protein CheA [Sphingobium sp.]|nr:chemotaxis protein CheA [Sphingobium sp.]MBP6113062.1 chemotaxis protein CheA [Sphingobium sp.]MBP8670936.1 chemotaxis protein CheA [Sphingobium sp.]MBP9158097.1 chemotaxis protein CheA [Sphingobium sp.]MCC6481952.1 chemotaxis protein CheA [Sphingomonadaceae bacterium]
MSDDKELDEIQAIFFEECTEGLATAETGLTAFANGDISADVIAGVFRAVHSIKGGAGAFGHDALLTFAHAFENVLDRVRAGEIAATADIGQQLLSAFDTLSDHVSAAMGRADVPQDNAALEGLKTLLALPMKGPSPTAEAPAQDSAEADEFGFVPVAVELPDFDAPAASTPLEEKADGIWRIAFAPSRAAMANGAEPLLVIRELERMGARVVNTDITKLPSLRELEPEQGYIRWDLLIDGTIEQQELDECFDFVAPDSLIEYYRDGMVPHASPTPQETTVAYAGIDDSAAARTEEAPEAGGEAQMPPLLSVVPPPAASPSALSTGEAKVLDAAVQTIRIDVTRLDMLLNLVGELVIRNSILNDRLAAEDQERVELPQLARLTREIQDNVMSLRAQPIRQAFSRVPRIVRELCAATAKQVNLEVQGEGTEVDKSVIEKIGEPLTHMIRNAIDHGLESPEERITAGKDPVGTVRLSAEQKGARIVIRVSDDGRGIDRERVRAKAIEKGIVAADAPLSDEDIDNLICAPGFSTAETISNISGRGVGMDVVRTNVEALGGRIEISSTPGQGTSFTMVLPLTLAILDGMIVRIDGQRYVVPLAHVVESIRPDPGQVKALSPTAEVIDLRGSYVPVRRVSDIFGICANDRRSPEESLVIIAESDMAGCIGLMVDTIDDRRELVVKSLDQNLYPINGLSGATILGDGSIALILDIDALVSAANSSGARFTLKGMAA